MTRGLVSVVLPVFNGELFLAQAIESVLAQTHGPIELIAIDDGSADGSAAILAGHGSRVTTVRQANAGVSAARNAGIERAKGEFVAFLDQDDWWLPGKLARQVALFQEHERLGLVHTAVSYHDEAMGKRVGPQDPTARPEAMAGACYETMLLSNPLVNSSVLVRRSVLERVGLCDLRIRGNTCQDYDLWLRIARQYEFGYVSEPLTVFRLHGGQGHRDRRSMLGEELKVLLRQRPECDWRSTSRGRRRLADLYDALATAHFEAGEPRDARRHFAKAAAIERSVRRLARFGASCLPYGIVHRVRQALHERKQIKRGLSSHGWGRDEG